jgi:hypothetical protein
VIIGAGIAGLYVGIEMLKKGYTDVTIYEKYNYVGGRIMTIHKKDGIYYEIGAARIHSSHRLVHSLLTRYGLDVVPLKDVPMHYISEYGATPIVANFEERVQGLLGNLYRLGPDVLQTDTIGRILCRLIGRDKASELFEQFPYETEVWKMRADVALEGFVSATSRRRPGPLGTRSGFSTVAGGLSSLIRAMEDEFKSLGGKIELGWTLTQVADKKAIFSRQVDGNSHSRNSNRHRRVTIDSDMIILALHVGALKHIKGIYDTVPELAYIDMAPLVRIYGKWMPSDAGWLKGMPKVVTGTPERYIIPVNPGAGLVMVSYTDGEDTSAWVKRSAPDKMHYGWEKHLMRGLRRLFPGREIPEPEWLKAYPWSDGTTYWMPGDYDPYVAAEKIMSPPVDGVHICGESLSVGKQAWVEGALEVAEQLLKIL